MTRDKDSIVGERIKQLRKEKGLTLKALADATGLSMSSISNYEYGFRQPNAKAMVAFETFFNVSGAYLTGETNEREAEYIWEDPEMVAVDRACDVALFSTLAQALTKQNDQNHHLASAALVEFRHTLTSSALSDDQRAVVLTAFTHLLWSANRFADIICSAPQTNEQIERSKKMIMDEFKQSLDDIINRL